MRPQILHLGAKNRNPRERADENSGGLMERRANFTPSSLDVQYPVADLPFGPGNSKQMCQSGSEEDPAWLLDPRKRAASHLRGSADPDPAFEVKLPAKLVWPWGGIPSMPHVRRKTTFRRLKV